MALTSMPRIARLDLAVVSLPDSHPEAASSPSAVVYGYVIDHPDGAIVVDTGVGFGNDFIDEVYAPQRIRLDEALIGVGVDPTSVVAVVNSHLHFDHCGQNPMLHDSTVPFFVQQSEVDQVERDPFYTDAGWALPPLSQRRLLDGDLTIAEGVRILSTPGHTAGHQSVVVESADARRVIAGQAVWHWRELVAEDATASNVDVPELRAAAIDSIRRIKALRPDVVHFSHCSDYRTQTEPQSGS